MTLDTKKNMDLLFYPKSIAILGCSEQNVGGSVLKNLISHHYDGKIYPIHPKHTEVCGVPAFHSLLDIPGPVDCAAIALRSDLVPTALDELHEKGVHAAVMFASGFSEVGGAGVELQALVKEKLQAYDIAACGPNCLGLLNAHENTFLYSASYEPPTPPGPIGVIAHSGSVCISLTNSAQGPGFSKVVSCGNEAGVPYGDFLRYMADDPQTKAVIGYVESIRNPQDLADAAQYMTKKGKLFVVMRVGRSTVAQKTAAAHSGALSSSNAVTEAFCRQNGIICVNTFDEALAACELFIGLNGNYPKIPTIAMASDSGGQLGYSCDIAQDYGVALAEFSDETKAALREILPSFSTPRNPVDVSTGLFQTDIYEACICRIAEAPEVGIQVICQDSGAALGQNECQLYANVMRALASGAKKMSKPMIVFSPLCENLHPELKAILKDAGIPLLQGVRETMAALKTLFIWVEWRDKLLAKEDSTAETKPHLSFDYGTGHTLSEGASKKLFRQYNIPCAKECLTHSAAEAGDAAKEMGFPVVMKVESADILHKTEAGAVRLNINSYEEAVRTYDEIMSNAKAYAPRAVIDGVSVQEMVIGGTEMMLGATNDALYGPCIILGSGGIYVEVFKDYTMRIAPVSEEEAWEMIGELKSKKILDGIRGHEPADQAALAKTIVALSNLMMDQKDEISELDINPLIVLADGKGVRAVDGVVVRK